MMTFGKAIYNERVKRGWTLKQASKAIVGETKISPSMINLYENERHPPNLPNAVALAKLFNLSLDEITGIKRRRSQ